MPRGRKRKISVFVPQPWIHNTSSEDEHEVQEPMVPGPRHDEGKYNII